MKRLLYILLFLTIFPVPRLLGSELDFSKAEICSGLLSGLIASARTLETNVPGVNSQDINHLRFYSSLRGNQLSSFGNELDRFSSLQNSTQRLPALSLIANIIRNQHIEQNFDLLSHWQWKVKHQEGISLSVVEALLNWKQLFSLSPPPFEYHPLLAQLWGLDSGLKALSQNQASGQSQYSQHQWLMNSTMANIYRTELTQIADSLTDPQVKSELYGIILQFFKVLDKVENDAAPDNWQKLVPNQIEIFKASQKMLEALITQYSADLRQMETPSGIFFPGQQVLLRETMNVFEVAEVHPREQVLLLKNNGSPHSTVSHHQVVPILKQIAITQADEKEVTFLEGDHIRLLNNNIPMEGTIRHILEKGNAFITFGVTQPPKIIPLADTLNLSHINRLGAQNLSSELIPLWNQYQPKLRSDISRPASEFGSRFSSLLERTTQLNAHDVPSWENQRREAKKILLDYPEIPGDLKSKIIDSFGIPPHSDNPPKTEKTSDEFFYKQSEKDLIDYNLNPVIERIKTLLGERLNKRTGPRMSRLNDLVKWSKNPTAWVSPEKNLFDQKRGWWNWHSSRDTLDWVGNVLLEEFSELPIDIRIRIPGFLREARTIDMIHSAEYPKFPEGSLLPSPEHEKTRRVLVDSLAIDLKRHYLTRTFPKNSRTVRLRELTEALESVEKTETFTKIEDPEKALKILAEIILLEFPDLNPEFISKIYLLSPNSATQPPNNPSRLPIVLDTDTLMKIQTVSEIRQLFSDFRFDLLHNSSRGNELRNLMALLGDLPNSEQALLESMALFNLTEGPDIYEALHEKIAEKMILEFPELSPSFRKQFLRLISNPSGELTTAANAMPKVISDSAKVPLFLNTLEPASEKSFKPGSLEAAESLAYFRNLGGWMRGKATLTPILILGPGVATNTWIAVSQRDFDNSLGVQNQLDLFQLPQKDLVVSPHPSPDLGGAEIGTNDTLKTKAPRLTTVLIPPTVKAQTHRKDLQTQRKIIRDFLLKNIK